MFFEGDDRRHGEAVASLRGEASVHSRHRELGWGENCGNAGEPSIQAVWGFGMGNEQFVLFFDLMVVLFVQKFRSKPMQVFGLMNPFNMYRHWCLCMVSCR